MFKLFASLYLFVVIALIGLTALMENVILPQQQQMQEPTLKALGSVLSRQAPSAIVDMAIQSGATVQEIATMQFALPEEQQQLLDEQGYIILYDAELGAELYFKGQKQQLLQVIYPTEQEHNITLYGLLFFVLMGLALAIWTWPLWRDIRILERTVSKVNKDGTLPEICLGPSSNLHNIGKALGDLSKQVQGLLQSQRELSGAVAHEFRTPLSRLKFALAMLDDRKDIDAAGMQKDVNELELLVQEMLDYATLESVSPDLSVAEIPLYTLCEELVNKLITKDSLTIIVQGKHAHILGDGHFIERAIQNVLVNASKYANAKITITIEEHEDDVKVIIDDDGMGITRENRSRIFEPFFRPDGARSRDKGGAGLGLAIVTRVQTWHQGKCWVDDSPYGGARFVLSYPKHSPLTSKL